MTDVEPHPTLKQKRNTDLSIKSPKQESEAFTSAFGAKISTPNDKAQPARPRFASGYSGKKSPRKGKLNEIDDESMLEFEKLENQIGQSQQDDDAKSYKSGKSRASSYRRPGINTSRQSNKSRQSMEDQDVVPPQIGIQTKKPKVVQHGCCYNVFCCGGCRAVQEEEDNEISLAQPEKITPKKKMSNSPSKTNKRKSFIGTEGIEEQSNEDDEESVKEKNTLHFEQDEIAEALERVQITSKENETEQSAQEILSSNREDKSPPLSENQQISQKSEADPDEPQVEEEEKDQKEEEDQELVKPSEGEEDGNETDGQKPYEVNSEEERKRLAAKKMYVIPEVDEDDYLSDPNASRLQHRKPGGSEFDQTKVDIIQEENEEDEADKRLNSSAKKRPRSSQQKESEEIDHQITQVAQSVQGFNPNDKAWIEELVTEKVSLITKTEMTLQKQVSRKISESIYCDADKPMTQEQVIAKIEARVEQERQNIIRQMPQIGGQYFKDFDHFVQNVDILDQQIGSDGLSVQSVMEKEMLKSSTSSQKLRSKQEVLRQSQEIAAKKVQERNSTTAEEKKKEAMIAKQKALKLLEQRAKRSSSAVLIQKVWKGHRQRIFFEELFVNFKSVKKTRRILDKKVEENTLGFKTEIVSMLRTVKEAIEKEEADLLLKYQNHCASQIQACWKGQSWRQQYPEFKKEQLMNRKIRAFVKGWRLRKTLQNQHIFTMRCMIRDLTQVQNHFVYVEKCDNMPLLEQLKKDRKKAVEDFIKAIQVMSTTGQWLDGYIPHIKKEEEPEKSVDSNTTEADSAKKERKPSNDQVMKELVSTDRLLYDDDMARLDKFIDFDTISEKNRKRDAILAGKAYPGKAYGQELGKGLDNLEDEELMELFKKKGLIPDGELIMNTNRTGHSRQSSSPNKKSEGKNRGSEIKEIKVYKDSERETKKLKDNPVSFDQMLEQALHEDKNKSPKKQVKARPGSQNFLKKKDRYDPLKSARTGVDIDSKRVNKKRVFQKEYSEEQNFQNHDNDISDQDIEPLNKSNLSSRWNKSFVQKELKPSKTKATPEFPSLTSKLQYYSTIQPNNQERRSRQSIKRKDSETQAMLVTQNLQSPIHGKTIYTNNEDLEDFNQSQNLPSQRNSLLEESVAMNINELESQFITELAKQDQEEDFFASSKILRKQDSQLPLLRANSMFFATFDEKVMESVQGDLQKEKENLMAGSSLPKYVKKQNKRRGSTRSKGRRQKTYQTYH